MSYQSITIDEMSIRKKRSPVGTDDRFALKSFDLSRIIPSVRNNVVYLIPVTLSGAGGVAKSLPSILYTAWEMLLQESLTNRDKLGQVQTST